MHFSNFKPHSYNIFILNKKCSKDSLFDFYSRHPSSLPNPRWISQRNHPDSDIPDYRFTHMVMQFGQFLDHDITLTPKDGKYSYFCKISRQNWISFGVYEVKFVDEINGWIVMSQTIFREFWKFAKNTKMRKKNQNHVIKLVNNSKVYSK